MAEEVREPGRLNNPNKGDLENSACHRDGDVGPGNNSDGAEPLEAHKLVFHALDHFLTREGRGKFFSAINFGDELDLFFCQTWF